MNKEELKEIIHDQMLRLEIQNKYQVFSEASFAKVMTQYFKMGFIMISANRSCEIEKGSPCSKEELIKQVKVNRENDKKIKRDIRNAGFGFIPTYGGYIEKGEDINGKEVEIEVKEPSFIVANRLWNRHESGDIEELKSLGIQLSKKYNQDSFLFKPPGDDKKSFFIDKYGQVTDEFSNTTVNNMKEIYFTQLRKSRPELRFTLKEGEFSFFVPKHPQTSATNAWSRMGECFVNGGESIKIKRLR